MTIPPELLIRRFKPTPGAIGVAEAIAIYNLALMAPSGTRVDVGSHAGKAAMAAACGLSKGDFYLIDPCYDLLNREAWAHSVQKEPENMPWAYVNEPDFYDKVRENIKIVSAMDVYPKLIGDYSEKVLQEFTNYSYAFIDSDDHCGGMALREVKILEDRVVKGGIVAFHDFLNQFQDPFAAHQYLISTGKYENVPIDWKGIFDYVRTHNLEEGNNSWHERGSNEFPCYVGAVKRI
jgi:hypothetical protein